MSDFTEQAEGDWAEALADGERAPGYLVPDEEHAREVLSVEEDLLALEPRERVARVLVCIDLASYPPEQRWDVALDIADIILAKVVEVMAGSQRKADHSVALRAITALSPRSREEAADDFEKAREIGNAALAADAVSSREGK